MQIQMMEINQLKPYKNNPRKNSDAIEPVAKSIKEFGFQQPIVVDNDNIIIVGHTRYYAAKKLNQTEVPVIVASNLTEKQCNAYRIADNKTNEFAEWEKDLLLDEILGLGEDDFLTGFTDQEIGDMIRGRSVRTKDRNKVPKKMKNEVSSYGDIWICGEHKVIMGDSSDEEILKALMGDERYDLIVTDPPYNIDYDGEFGRKLKNDKLKNNQFEEFLTKTFSANVKYLRPGRSAYFALYAAYMREYMNGIEKSGLKYIKDLIWVKNTVSMPGMLDYTPKHETFLYTRKEGGTRYFNNQHVTKTSIIQDDGIIDYEGLSDDEWKDLISKSKTTVLRYKKRSKNDLHPTMKPVELISEMIRNSSQSGEIVGDFFGGSGTTLIASQCENRKARVIELDPIFADVIVRRYVEFTGKPAFRLSDNADFTTLDNEINPPGSEDEDEPIYSEE